MIINNNNKHNNYNRKDSGIIIIINDYLYLYMYINIHNRIISHPSPAPATTCAFMARREQVKDFYDAESGGRVGQTSFQSIEDLIYAAPGQHWRWLVLFSLADWMGYTWILIYIYIYISSMTR